MYREVPLFGSEQLYLLHFDSETQEEFLGDIADKFVDRMLGREQ
jgi:hypothetical protein